MVVTRGGAMAPTLTTVAHLTPELGGVLGSGRLKRGKRDTRWRLSNIGGAEFKEGKKKKEIGKEKAKGKRKKKKKIGNK